MTDDTNAPRPTNESAEDTTPSKGNPDLHGAAKDVEEKRASGDPETTGA